MLTVSVPSALVKVVANRPIFLTMKFSLSTNTLSPVSKGLENEMVRTIKTETSWHEKRTE